MGVKPNINHLPARNEVTHAYSSHEKVLRVFGPRRLYSLEEGLARMAEWVKWHGARSSKKFENIEVEKNFPLAWKMS
jgi:UDP-glucose 4-epimerase